ncbi:MAG: hypothetical protein QG670_2099 [Thermoproteota archaeon]|nr:hypothetical protein [Thermoproteota archaeon]
MITSPEIAWIVPVIIPAIMGLLVGLIVKRSIKLMFTIVALVVLLVLIGLVSLTFQDVLDQALKFLPRIINTGSGLIDVLPYSATTFLIGLGLGLWRG